MIHSKEYVNCKECKNVNSVYRFEQIDLMEDIKSPLGEDSVDTQQFCSSYLVDQAHIKEDSYRQVAVNPRTERNRSSQFSGS